MLEIECEGALYKLTTMNPDEFPELPKIEIENSIDLEQNMLKNMIRKTIFAVSTEENRPIFTGCLFEVENNKLNVVAVDGFRLALRSIYLPVKVNDFKILQHIDNKSSQHRGQNRNNRNSSHDIWHV